jgi:hypothetical protein
MARQKKGRPILPGLDVNANSGKGGFAGSPRTFTVHSVHAAERAFLKDQLNVPAEGDTMNIETLELNAVAEAVKSDESLELLALSLDDLDLVGGGSTIGNLY